MIRLAILTVSDTRTPADDRSGDVAAAWAAGRGDVVAARAVVADDTGAIAAQLAAWCDADAADLVLTSGGTGLAPRDVTPEATRAVLEREAPGIAECVRAAGAATFPRAWLSRGVAGTRARTLVVNLPGSPGGVRDGLAALDTIVDHAVAVLRGAAHDHAVDEAHGAGAPPAGALEARA